MVVAPLVITISVLPLFLFGALAFMIRDDSALSRATLGITATSFYCTSALTLLLAGRPCHRLAPERTMTVGALISGWPMLGIAVLARSRVGLPVFLGDRRRGHTACPTEWPEMFTVYLAGV